MSTPEAPEPANPPKAVQVSFWLWVASGIVFLAGYVILFLNRNQLVAQIIKTTTDPAATPDRIRSGATQALVIALVGAVCLTALTLLFAWKARQGTRSARTVLVVLTVISLLAQIGLGLGSLITLLGTLVGLVALLLMFLPKSTTYFPKVSRRAL
ncbi:hypothetical protein [Amycolatopsis pithecellobii]|uniref:hypothetical protein n=1 Tax=Amycolatopsis pithecellobii TaxID=664692 RepID=UPI001AA07860|nr:hypothetical protein [Amycolatopsis pithecellobii]